MPLLLVCVILFLGVAQFYQWSSELSLPFPVLLLAGAVLAVLSNFRDRQRASAISPSGDPPVSQSTSVSVSQNDAAPVLPPNIRPAANPRPVAEPQLPTFASPAQPTQSISFTLNAPTGGDIAAPEQASPLSSQ